MSTARASSTRLSRRGQGTHPVDRTLIVTGHGLVDHHSDSREFRLHGLGHDVLRPTVAALGSIKVRSDALETQILAKWPNPDQQVYLLAHSMGGLDCRAMLQRNSQLSERVPRLVTRAGRRGR